MSKIVTVNTLLIYFEYHKNYSLKELNLNPEYIFSPVENHIIKNHYLLVQKYIKLLECIK
jgi:hypothetical protein